jgi:hypothetical protein
MTGNYIPLVKKNSKMAQSVGSSTKNFDPKYPGMNLN